MKLKEGRGSGGENLVLIEERMPKKRTRSAMDKMKGGTLSTTIAISLET